MPGIDEYRYLWDGSEPGWRLRETDFTVHYISFCFGECGPSKADVLALRRLLDEFRDRPMHEVWNQLRGSESYTIPRDFTNLEMRSLVERAERAGLTVTLDGEQRGGYLPISADGGALIIEDDELAKAVAEKMIAAGVPVEHEHID